LPCCMCLGLRPGQGFISEVGSGVRDRLKMPTIAAAFGWVWLWDQDRNGLIRGRAVAQSRLDGHAM
jgi:hypothetical protein